MERTLNVGVVVVTVRRSTRRNLARRRRTLIRTDEVKHATDGWHLGGREGGRVGGRARGWDVGVCVSGWVACVCTYVRACIRLRARVCVRACWFGQTNSRRQPKFETCGARARTHHHAQLHNYEPCSVSKTQQHRRLRMSSGVPRLASNLGG